MGSSSPSFGVNIKKKNWVATTNHQNVLQNRLVFLFWDWFPEKNNETAKPPVPRSQSEKDMDDQHIES